MKQCQKWWNEEQTAMTGGEFLAKHGGLTTQEQVLDVLVEMTWRAALEWVAKRGMHHYGNDFLTDMSELSTEIQIELGMLDENGKVINETKKT